MRLLGQAVKTPPSHGGIRGSTPLGATRFEEILQTLVFAVFFYLEWNFLCLIPAFFSILVYDLEKLFSLIGNPVLVVNT